MNQQQDRQRHDDSYPINHRLRGPIAIIGVGCRFPGNANCADDYWRLIKNRVDAVVEIPTDRWDLKTFYDPRPSIPGKTNIRHGGFIEDIYRFDPDFFGISPREASRMDPQQRLLLEVAWEAIEDGGQILENLQGSPTGVFVGISSWDYTMIQAGYRDRKAVDVYTNTGGALSIAANRISYCFDLTGPSMAVDTACSSGLTAVHLACNAIWNGECKAALAGAVSMLITPGPYLGFSMLNMLSPDGRCKAFDAHANGFVRSEGAGIVMLKPLLQAIADGDPIYALIRGTAVNQDGSTTGLTVPSQTAQNRLITEACRNARVEPRQIQFVEAHGTGTLVGDPIEARALGEALRVGRAASQPCRVGSVKTNIGHLESAAGIAGLIKVALALKNGTIPANLHFQTPNPEIDFDQLGLTVPTESEPWPEQEGRRLAGVNSFGFGGSNAHIVLEGLSADAEANAKGYLNGSGSPTVVPISARSPQALKDLAAKYADHLSSHELSWGDILYTTRYRRTNHEFRAAVVAESRDELVQRLRDFATGEQKGFLAHDRHLPDRKQSLVMVCCGQGPQWWAMGRELMQVQPVFRDLMSRCDAQIRMNGADWSLIEELNRPEVESRIGDTAFAQPAIFAIQVSLAAVWQSWGIQPSAFIGHSVGEVAAAYLAGALDFEDAVRVIYQRGRCMSLASKGGGMLAVALSEAEAEDRIGKFDGWLNVAAVNAPRSLTISGDMEPLRVLADELQRDRVYAKFLKVNQAFHSRHMDPAEQELLSSLTTIQPRPSKLPLISTVIGGNVEGRELTAEYWWRNIRQAVRFSAGIDRLLDQGYSTFLELSPHPVLVSSIAECAMNVGKQVKSFGSLTRQAPELPSMLRSLGALYCAGFPVDWRVLQDSLGRYVPLPSYPWQREVYWHEAEESRVNRLGMQNAHPLLGHDLKTSTPLWQSILSINHLPYMQDHRVQGVVIVPATAMLETAMAIGKENAGSFPYFIEEVKLLKAILLPAGNDRIAQAAFDPQDSTFQIRTGLAEPNANWSLNCTGKIHSRIEETARKDWSPKQVLERCTERLEKEQCYQLFEKLDIKYGPDFQGIKQLWRGQGEALGEVVVPEGIGNQIGDYQFHPAILDACLQCVFGTIPHDRIAADSGRGVFLPVEIQEVRVYGRPTTELYSHARLESINRQSATVQLQVYDMEGNLLVDIRGLVCQYVGMRGDAASSLDDLLYEFKWRLTPTMPAASFDQSNKFGSLTELVNKLAIADDGGRERQHDSPHARLLVSLNQLSAAYIVEAFERLGWSFQPDEQFSLTDLITKLGVANQHFRVIPRYLQMLEEEGILGVDSPGRRWRVIKKPNFEPSLDSWRKLLRFYPAHYAELTMIRRCATRLDEVLRGELNPLPLIFPEGSLDTAEHLYQDSPSVRIYNLLAQKAISELIAQLPPDRTIRILEIGAGTGGLTSYLLPHLPVDRTQYVFSDLSNHFFIKSKQKLADFPFVDYRLLDIEKDPLEQKFAAHSFDIVIASQVLHATEDLTRTLTNVRKLVSDGGLLVMLELLKPARWVDLVFGLTEGWWRFKDLAIRPDYPLLPFEKWRDLLVTVGFGETVNVAQSRQVDGFGSAVILSRAQVSHRSDSTTSVAMDSLANGLALGDKNSKILASKWLVFADQGGLGTSFAEEVHRQGGDCYLVRPGNEFLQINEREFVVNPRHLADFRQLLEQFADASPPPMILHLWNLDAADNHRLTPDLLIQAHDVGCLSMVHLYQAWSKTVRSDSQAWVVTRNGQSTTVGSAVEPIQMAQTSVWGLCRVLFNEYSRIKGRLIDLGGSRQAEVATLVSEITLDSPDDEVVLRDSARYVNRYLRSSLAASHSDLSEGQTVRYRLDGQFGELDALAFRECARVLPARDQIEIEVRAAALNFSDVMKALGLYPGLPDGPVPIGIECAGRVVSVGADVTGFRIGDDVLALAPFALGSHVTTHEKLCVRMPKNLDYTEATTIPIAFLTASFCLENLARLQPGERILIHSAAGGVGLAAIQIAQNVGAEVFATAGSSEKREFLRSIGIEHVMNSRTLAFTDQIMELTNGQGVDVVLNSLSGEALSQSMSVLGEFGRFVEIGKRDIYMNRMLGMRPFKKNVSFMAVDLDRVMREKPALMAKLLQQVVTLTDDGRYQPLPHRVFSATNIKSAFRYMAQAKHIGKVVVSFEDSLIQPLAALPEPMKFREDATYFISGGLGGFGLLVAQWMAENGAKNFILMGRRGIHSDSAKAGVERLRKMGSNPLVVKGDVARPDDVQRALSEAKQLPPVRGVLHAAMHLEDCLLNHLDRDTMLRVVEPKVLGAWNLHLATLDQPLDFFVSFSSMASVFGLPGQANYAAANVFLDSLPNYRRQIGASGLTINWGYLREVGYVAERMELVERFESQGFTGISPVEALALLGRLMTGSSRHVSIVRMDWSRAKELGLPSLGAPRFQELVDRAKNSSRQEGAGARRALLAVLPEKRKPILLGILKERVGAVLGAAPDKIDVDTPLTSVGVDSLMAVELRNWVESELRVSLPIVELMEGPTVNRLADLLLEQFSKGEQGTSEPLCENSKAEESPSVPTTPVFEQTSLDESVVTMVAELSDAEVDAMLSSLVESSENTDPKGLASFSG